MANKRTYLVTGAAGYLGSEVCRQLLEQNESVRAFVLPNDPAIQYIPKDVEIVEGDLRDKASLETFFHVDADTETVVLHCASIVALGMEMPKIVMDINVGGTQNIIDLCLEHKECKKLVYVGRHWFHSGSAERLRNERNQLLRSGTGDQCLRKIQSNGLPACVRCSKEPASERLPCTSKRHPWTWRQCNRTGNRWTAQTDERRSCHRNQRNL